MKMTQDSKTTLYSTTKKYRIDFHMGSGSILLGAVMMLICFVIILTIMRVYEIQNVDAHSQVVCDAITNSATAYGQDYFDVDEDIIREGVHSLIAENSGNLGGASSRILFELSGPITIEKTNEREFFNDKAVTVKITSNYTSPLRKGQYIGQADYTAESASKVVAYAQVPLNSKLSAQDAKAISYAIAHATGQIQRNAIMKGALMLGWLYPTDANKAKGFYRWTTRKNSDGTYYGSRDCSSFVKTCYQDYCTFWNDVDTYTVNMISLGLSKKCIILYGGNNFPTCNNFEEFASYLQVGDILMFSGNPRRSSYVGYVGHTAIYLGQGKIMHSSPPNVRIENWPVSRGYHYYHAGQNVFKVNASHTADLYAIIRIPDSMGRSGSEFDLYNFAPHA